MSQQKKAPSSSQKSMSIVKDLEVLSDCKTVLVKLSPEEGRDRIIPIVGGDFAQWFSSEHYKKLGKFPSKNTINGVISVLCQKAFENPKPIKLYKRFAKADGKYFIDLDEKDSSDVIEIDDQGWRITKTKAVLFASEPHLEPIARPRKGGDPTALLKYLNIIDEMDQLMVLIWLIALPACDIEHPLLLLRGSPASGKTSAGELLRKLLDPASPLKISTTKKDDELALAFYKNPISFFDNYSRMNDAVADMFCKAVTGDGFTKRSLYHNTMLIHLEYKRPVILSSVEHPSDRPDFVSRCIEVQMPSISSEKRIPESILTEGFEKELPDILGGMLDVLSEALAIRKKMRVTKKTRMADFDELGAAIAFVLGKNPERFIEARLEAERQVKCSGRDADFLKALSRVLSDAGGAVEMDMQSLLCDLNDQLLKMGRKGMSAISIGRKLELLNKKLEQVGIKAVKTKRSQYSITDTHALAGALVCYPQYCQDCIHGEGSYILGDDNCKLLGKSSGSGGNHVKCPHYAFEETEWEIDEVDIPAVEHEGILDLSELFVCYGESDFDILDEDKDQDGMDDDYDGYVSIFPHEFSFDK